jgi:hypothetical protein
MRTLPCLLVSLFIFYSCSGGEEFPWDDEEGLAISSEELAAKGAQELEGSVRVIMMRPIGGISNQTMELVPYVQFEGSSGAVLGVTKCLDTPLILVIQIPGKSSLLFV